MFRFFALAFAALFFFSGSALAADADAPAASTQPPIARIGVVDLQTIATESEPAKAFNAEMEKKYSKERDSIEKKGAALKKQAEGLKGSKVSEQKKVDFIKAKQKLDQQANTYQRRVQQDEIKNRQEMITLIFSAAYEVAKAKGYNFVVDVNAGGVLYADRSMDLTKAVLEQVNKIYKEKQAKAPEKAKDAAPASDTPAKEDANKDKGK